jgi:CBS domain containing-hemolysin-like protein
MDVASLDVSTLREISAKGFSHIPVFDRSPHNMKGVLCMKNLLLVDPGNKYTMSVFVGQTQNCSITAESRSLDSIELQNPLVVHPDALLLDTLREFQMESNRMAFVTRHPEECMY